MVTMVWEMMMEMVMREMEMVMMIWEMVTGALKGGT